ITLTSIIFGLAHYPLGSWGPGKLLSATFSGFLLGMVYIFYGIQASILLHWYFNYYFNAFEIAGNFFQTASITLLFFWILNLALGILGLAILIYQGLHAILKRK
ncbi:MAG: CPBP family glutamic-type intramembrane protease, partial [Candidatus Bathyarchaeia archaeon]